MAPRLFALPVGEEIVDRANYDPLGDDVGTKVRTPYFAYLIEHEQGPVLFDTGAHRRHTGAYDPERGDPPPDGAKIVIREGEDLTGRLAQVGLAPADIPHVVLSHLHIDHAGGVELFPHATFHIQRRELEFAHWPPVYQRGFYIREDFDHPVRWNELPGETDLFGDGRLILFPTPGHTAGHQSLLVRLDGSAVILVADAAYSPHNMTARRLPGILWSPDAMVASWEAIEARRDAEDAELIFTHDPDWRERVRCAPEAHYA